MYGVVNLKRWLQTAAAAVLAVGAIGVFGALLTVFAADGGVQVPVIMYHAVIDDSRRLGQYVVSPAELESDFAWLQQNGYQILREHIAQEGRRLYTVLEVTGGEMPPLSPGELWAGRRSDDPLRGAYLDMMAGKVSRALEGQRASSRRDEGQIEALAQVLAEIRTMREEL